jgi:tetratricopeptide (TPR) repeat protein
VDCPRERNSGSIKWRIPMSDQEIRRYEEMLADDPKSRAFAPLAEAYRKAGRLDDAIKIAETGLRYHPDYSGGLVVLGRTLFEKGELARASEMIIKAVQEAPDNYMAQKILAKISMAQGEDDRALKALEAAKVLSPGDMEIEEALQKIHGKISHPGGIDFMPENAPEGSQEGPDTPEPETAIDKFVADPSDDDQLPPLLEGIQMEDDEEQELVIHEGNLTELSTDIGDLEEPPEWSKTAREDAASGAGEEVPSFVSGLSSLSTEDSPGTFISEQAVEEAVSGVEEIMETIVPPGDEVAEISSGADEKVVSREVGKPEEEDISTETLADLYAQQGLKEKAAQIYGQLLKGRPEDQVLVEKFRKVTLNEMDGTPVKTSGGEGAPVPEVVEEPGPGKDLDPLTILEAWLQNAERMKQR